MADIYIAVSGFACESPAGERVIVKGGDTAEGGHWLLDRNPEGFRLLEAKYQAAAKSKPVAAAAAAAVKVAQA